MASLRAQGWITAAMVLIGCAHQRRAVAPLNPDETFRIGSEDVLDISVWRDPDLSRVIPVRPDGFISLPLAGELKAEGRTPGELASDIKTKLAPFLQEPKVTVMLHEVNSSRVFVTGEVTKPGVYPLRGKVTVLQAIALAGGFSAFANSDGIKIIRLGQNGGQISVRYSDLISDDAARSAGVALLPGDTVVVP